MKTFAGLSSYRSRPFFPRLSAVSLAVAGLLAIAIPAAPAAETPDLQFTSTTYESCARRLLKASGIEREDIARACARALHPKRFSKCVLKIRQKTNVPATDILDACKRVRRPLQLRDCVLGLNDATKRVRGTEILDYCRRSLLPIEFARCVIGLQRQIPPDAPPPKDLMEACITADDYPRDLDPTFIPSDTFIPGE